MSYVDYLKSGFEILKLNRKEISNVAKDEKATGWGILTLVLTGAVVGLLATLLTLGLGAFLIVLYPIMMVVGLYIGAGILYLVSKIFGGNGTYMGLVRPSSVSSYISILGLIPFVGFLAGIWNIVVWVVTVSETQKLSVGKSVAVVLIPMIIIGVLAILLFAALFASLLAVGGLGALGSTGGY